MAGGGRARPLVGCDGHQVGSDWLTARDVKAKCGGGAEQVSQVTCEYILTLLQHPSSSSSSSFSSSTRVDKTGPVNIRANKTSYTPSPECNDRMHAGFTLL
ncbi:hypothetical protein E2C01_068768 [Portunus trituberculatus]|uniref:Uncharacterized protein n=1 Tax=Portunus trituberculatus TaxID=210409 RepID=A0A5B7HN96_PORTR|nr:hypothetical protein [Portunus trituberculatus]